MQMLLSKNSKKKFTPDDMLQVLHEVTPQLITYGSNGVLKKWGKLRVEMAAVDSAVDVGAVLLGMEDLFKEMRKDVGHSSLTIQEGDISRLFINDIDKYIGKGSGRTSQLPTGD